MSQSITPTKSGGRVIKGDTPFGVWHAECDAQGNLLAWRMEVRTPQAPPSAAPMPAHLMKPMGTIPDDYTPTPENATKGGCGCDPVSKQPPLKEEEKP